MINIKKLLDTYIVTESSYEHMDMLIDYLKNKHIKFTNPIVRLAFSRFISTPEQYDKIFDITGEFVNLDRVADDATFAEQLFNSLSGQEQERFKTEFLNKKVEDPILEPAFKFMTIKQELPSDTILVRFVGDNQLAKVRQEGFKLGINDLDKLHATEYYDKQFKQEGGYIFAYVADSPEAKKQAKATVVGESYGENCIFFKYPALVVYHKLDGEEQTIAYGPDIQPDEMIFTKGTDNGMFIILNGGFDKTPKTYSNVVKLIKKI